MAPRRVGHARDAHRLDRRSISFHSSWAHPYRARVEEDLTLIERILERLPAGDIRATLPAPGEEREGMAIVEGFRGDILAWLRLGADGRIARCHLRDPSWFQWPLLEAVIEGNIVADFPICNKSFNCSYSGHDL